MTEPAPVESGGNPWTRKYGPLPLWVWLIVGVGILALVYFRNKSANAATSSTAPTTDAAQIPQFINQSYTNITPPATPGTTPATPPAPANTSAVYAHARAVYDNYVGHGSKYSGQAKGAHDAYVAIVPTASISQNRARVQSILNNYKRHGPKYKAQAEGAQAVLNVLK